MSKPTPLQPEQCLALARQTFAIEAQAVQALGQRVGPSFVQAIERLLACRGRVVVMGMGKSGHVGRKIAATLASTAAAKAGLQSTMRRPAERRQTGTESAASAEERESRTASSSPTRMRPARPATAIWA